MFCWCYTVVMRLSWAQVRCAKSSNLSRFQRALQLSGRLLVVEKLGTNKVGKDFGEILNPYGDDWSIRWADGKTEMIAQPQKNLALSLQCAQVIMVKGPEEKALRRCAKPVKYRFRVVRARFAVLPI